MKFSIVIPVFNKAEYLGLTLISALLQSFVDFEIVLVDDGSTDGSLKLAETFSDPRLRVFKQANAGVSAARNLGIGMARGEWICFLDADDWLHPEYLATQYATLTAHPQAAVVATRFRPIPDSPDWIPKIWPVPAADFEVIDDLPSRWMQGTPFFTGSIAIRRDLLAGLQPCFPPGESFGEDLDLWFRLAERSSIVLRRAPLVAYRTAARGSLAESRRGTLATGFLSRLQERARGYPRSDPRRRSALRFVTQQYVTQARFEAARSRRAKALGHLLTVAPGGLGVARWWTTLAMTAVLPGSVIDRWQGWREERTACQ